MMDFRPILLVVGVLLTTLGCFMVIPAIIDLAFDNRDWVVFLASALITVFIGVALWFTNRGTAGHLNLRQAFVLVTVAWLALTAFGALPLAWSELELNYTDAFFESMSGLTTTGATVIVGLDHAPPGLLFWRSLLQWLGGLGILVMAVAVLPMLQIGGMQLFKAEAFETPDKILPRATQISGSMTLVYMVLTIACVAAYVVAGMKPTDALIHAMTTVATGGFSSHDASIGYFQSAAIEYVAVVFMIAGSLPFLLYIRALQGGGPMVLLRDSQIRWFFAFLFLLVVLAWQHLLANAGPVPRDYFREALFNVVSIMTGTGYATAAYDTWGGFAIGLFFVAMFLGGCAGSTSCGIKTFRFIVLFEDIRQHLRRIVYPSGVFVKRYNGRPLPDHVSAAVLSFLYLYILCFLVLSVLLSLTELDSLTALSAAASAISNVGPALGQLIGPAGTYADLSDTAKWLLSAGMLIGRLEIFTVLVLFMPAFWRH